jgi:3-hydroxybutyryl-CoA dehydratase
MSNVPVAVGDTASFSKTVTETDVYTFAGLSGDLAPNHVNEEYMKLSPFGRRIAHGALTVAFMSAASARLTGKHQHSPGKTECTPVALGFDKLRFLKPVFFGDTLTVVYRVVEIDNAHKAPRSIAEIEVRNQRNEITAVSKHINAWVSSH